MQCRSCKEFGHVEKVCKFKINKKRKTHVVDNLEKLFLALATQLAFCGETLLIDSGCSHLTSPD